MGLAAVEEKEKQEEKQKIEELKAYIDEVKDMEYSNSYLIAVLHRAQKIYRYLREDIIKEISEYMKIPVSRIWGVATFFNFFSLTPRGEYIITVCLGTACYVKGSEKIMETIKHELDIDVGETTEDMKFTLLEARCLGACALAPVLTVNDKIYPQMTTKKARELLNRYRKIE